MWGKAWLCLLLGTSSGDTARCRDAAQGKRNWGQGKVGVNSSAAEDRGISCAWLFFP